MKVIKIYLLSVILLYSVTINANNKKKVPKEITISKTQLLNKIKGGWAGQTIAVSWSWESEFLFPGSMIPGRYQLEWNEDVVGRGFNNDDVYLDITFVEIIERLGLDAPADSFAVAFANAGYYLWGANQTGRYNILNGIMPPESGHWKNNPNANDIDYQIEADFSGLMSPGMVNASAEIGDRVGHIMNYGEGWYSGVYVGAIYALAFVSDDIEFILTEALKIIPEESSYYQAMSQVIGWCKEHDNWKDTWCKIAKSDFSKTSYSPQSVFKPGSSDALLNMTYAIIGLMYGESDFYKTVDIAMRCGQDSDCNPASAGGILGTILGYDGIPDYWIKPFQKYENVKLDYTSSSLNEVYQLGLKHSLENIVKNGGSVRGETITIKYQEPEVLPLEVSFPNIYPIRMVAGERKNRPPYGSIKDGNKEESYTFTGTGIVINGSLAGGPARVDLVIGPDAGKNLQTGRLPLDYVAELQVTLNGKVDKIVKLPADFLKRSQYLYWNFELPKGEHVVTLKWLNPDKRGKISIKSFVEYSDQPLHIEHQ